MQMVKACEVVLHRPYRVLILNEHEATGSILWRQSVDTEEGVCEAHGRSKGPHNKGCQYRK